MAGPVAQSTCLLQCDRRDEGNHWREERQHAIACSGCPGAATQAECCAGSFWSGNVRRWLDLQPAVHEHRTGGSVGRTRPSGRGDESKQGRSHDPTRRRCARGTAVWVVHSSVFF
eukprot:scaffold1526_cov88-Isochrysis_galbana.AAC.5